MSHQENQRASHERKKWHIQFMLFSFCQSEPARGVNKPAQHPLGLDPYPILARKSPFRTNGLEGTCVLFSDGCVQGDRAIKFGPTWLKKAGHRYLLLSAGTKAWWPSLFPSPPAPSEQSSCLAGRRPLHKKQTTWPWLHSVQEEAVAGHINQLKLLDNLAANNHPKFPSSSFDS